MEADIVKSVTLITFPEILLYFLVAFVIAEVANFTFILEARDNGCYFAF